MFVVALTRWTAGAAAAPAALEREVQALGPLLGMGAYELRMLLSGAPPIVLVESDDLAFAKRVLAELRARGHGAVACDAASVTPSAQMVVPKTFRFEPDAFVAEAPGFAETAVPYQDVLALLVAQHTESAESTSEHTEKKLSMGRAALTGGLVLTKSKTTTERATKEEREQVLYVMNRQGAGHVLLRETRLKYQGLGSRLGRSSAESFAATVALLREHAPGARFDDRLLRRRRSATSLRVSGTSAARTVTTSNDAEVDLAAHLLTVAVLQGQA